MPFAAEWSPDPPDSKDVFNKSLSLSLHLQLTGLNLFFSLKPPALLDSLVCWDPGIAGLVAAPLLLLEVEVEVLLQVVRVELTLGRHNRHLRKSLECFLWDFLGHYSHWFSCQQASKSVPASRQIPFPH